MAGTVKKILIAGASLAGAWWLLGRANKATRLADNIYVDTTLQDVTPGLLNSTFKLGILIRNISGFNLTIKNVFSKVYLVKSDGSRVEIGVTDMSPKVEMPNGGNGNFSTSLRVSNITLASNILKTAQIEVVTWYDYLGQQLSYTSSIDMSNINSSIRAKLGFKELSGII